MQRGVQPRNIRFASEIGTNTRNVQAHPLTCDPPSQTTNDACRQYYLFWYEINLCFCSFVRGSATVVLPTSMHSDEARRRLRSTKESVRRSQPRRTIAYAFKLVCAQDTRGSDGTIKEHAPFTIAFCTLTDLGYGRDEGRRRRRSTKRARAPFTNVIRR